MTAQTAQDLSSVLNSVKERVSNFATERKQLADSLRQIITGAQDSLGQLGEAVATGRRRGRPAGAAAVGRRRGPGRPKGSGAKQGTGKRGRPKGRKMSAAARKRISEAQKARWAKQKAGK